jgi:hypothetical protein
MNDTYKIFLEEAISIKEAYECGYLLGTQPHIEEMFSDKKELAHDRKKLAAGKYTEIKPIRESWLVYNDVRDYIVNQLDAILESERTVFVQILTDFNQCNSIGLKCYLSEAHAQLPIYILLRNAGDLLVDTNAAYGRNVNLRKEFALTNEQIDKRFIL